MRDKVEHELTVRHDPNWLKHNGILKGGSPSLHESKRAMEFNLKKQTLKSHLSLRPSKEELMGMHIIPGGEQGGK